MRSFSLYSAEEFTCITADSSPPLSINRAITRPINEAVIIANRLADGDLTVEVDVQSKDETGELLGRFLVAQPLGPKFVAFEQGTWSFSWDGSSLGGEKLAPGVYYAKVRNRATEGRVDTAYRKLVWMR